MKTALCTRVGMIEVPIIQTPMSGAVGPALALAVSNARSRDRRAGEEHAGQVGAVKLRVTTASGHFRPTRPVLPVGSWSDAVLDFS
jgi:hypothetical protein